MIVRLLMVLLSIGFAGCKNSPSTVIFELPAGFRGAFAIKADPLAPSATRVGKTAVIKITGSHTLLSKPDEVFGDYARWIARFPDGTELQVTPITPDAAIVSLGFFGCGTTSNARGVFDTFFVGSGDELFRYRAQVLNRSASVP